MRKNSITKKRDCVINVERRRFLRYVVTSVGLFLTAALLRKLFGSLSFFENRTYNDRRLREIGFGFKVEASKDKMIFYNKRGERLFSVSQDGEMEIGE